MRFFLHILFLIGIFSAIDDCSSKNNGRSKNEKDQFFEMMRESTVLSYSSYCQQPDILNWDCFYCNLTKEKYEEVFVSGETESRNFMFGALKNKETLVLVFRGTVSFHRNIVTALLNWIKNLEAFFVELDFAPNDEIKVHEGFNTCYQELREISINYILKMFEKHGKGIKGIEFVGHSLGGAILTQLVAEIVATHEKIGNKDLSKLIETDKLRMLTLGSPRVGNEAFYDWFMNFKVAKHSIRMVNQHDPVTSVPPTLVGYHHIGREVYFRNNTFENYDICDLSGEDPNCSSKEWMYNPGDHSTYLGIDSRTHCTKLRRNLNE